LSRTVVISHLLFQPLTRACLFRCLSAAVCAPFLSATALRRVAARPGFSGLSSPVTTVCVVFVTHGRHLSSLVPHSPGRARFVSLLQLSELRVCLRCSLTRCSQARPAVSGTPSPMAIVVPLSHMVVIPHLLLQPLARCASFSRPYRSCLRSESISNTANSLQPRLTRHNHHVVWSFVLPRRMPPSLASCSRPLLQPVGCVLVSWHDALVGASTSRQIASLTWRVLIFLSRAAATRLVSVSWPRYS
jgi:hypothetical protein